MLDYSIWYAYYYNFPLICNIYVIYNTLEDKSLLSSVSTSRVYKRCQKAGVREKSESVRVPRLSWMMKP